MLLSAPSFLRLPKPGRSPRTATLYGRSTLVSVKFSLSTRDGSRLPASEESIPVLHSQFSASLPIRNLGFRRDPEIGLASLLFVISMAMGSFFSLAIVSLPALSAFKRLGNSMNKLSRVVSEEVPGTLSSLKLSGLEINDLTSQLNFLRQIISGRQRGKEVKTNKPRSGGRRHNEIID